jgi:predicted nucleic acid-binding protein
MIVYVESNFIWELAYLQEQHDSCDSILSLAEQKAIQIVLPTFSAIEVRVSASRRAHRRRKFHDRLNRELRELSRSRPYQEISSRTEPLIAALIESAEAERDRLESVLSRLLSVCQLSPIDGTTVQSANGYTSRLKLSPNDAVIFASIMQDLATKPAGPKCFLNRNSKDFADPDVYDELRQFDCKLVPSFDGGLKYIRKRISPKAN